MMQTIPLYHTTGISGFRITRIRTVARSGKTVEIESRDECAKAVRREGRLSRRGCGGRRQLVITIERKDAVCPDCGSAKAKYYKAGVRLIQCQGFGRLKAFVEVAVHHIYCPECRSMSYEHLEFLTNPRARVTRAFEKELVAERRRMSITDVAEVFGVSRRTVREAEVRALELKYRSVPLKGVRRIGIDEVYVFHGERGGRQFVTVVRDLDTGRVLNVSRGKGEDALKMFASRLRRSGVAAEIECVTMDMANAFANFAEHNLPNALVVFDHFHVVKMVNDIINKIRRAAMAKINAETRQALRALDLSKEEREVVARLEKKIKDRQEKAKKVLKGNMKLPLMNGEDVEKDPKAKAKLDKMLEEYSDLGKAYLLKEELRSIYANAKAPIEAKALLEAWIAKARASDVRHLETMANTMEKNLEGVLGFWKFPGATNAKTEGFNNKIRWLVKQAYGYRDWRYFRLKVFDLPNLKPRDSDC
jgi:transposase